MHLAENGTELLRVSGFENIYSISVNSRDGSCWVIDSRLDAFLVHLAEDGTELWRGVVEGHEVVVNPADGSCWLNNTDGLILHLAEDGTELWRTSSFGTDWSVTVNPTDGSVWVADRDVAQIIHLVIPGWQPSIFYDVPWYFWAFDETGACYNAGIVGGYGDGLYHPELAVTRDQMAVYISRALAGGDEYVPEFTGTPTFPDVPAAFWALDHVEYTVAQNVVTGYEDGTYHPEYAVTRDQMAVYVARAMVAPTGEAALADYVPADPRNFPDVASGFWAYTHVEYCVENGVVSGYLDGLYHPEVVVTRDQMAVYVARAFGLMP